MQIANKSTQWAKDGERETYFLSLSPMNSFLHPYAIIAPTPTRYQTGRKPRIGMLRCLRLPSQFNGSIGVLGRFLREIDFVLNGIVSARGR